MRIEQRLFKSLGIKGMEPKPDNCRVARLLQKVRQKGKDLDLGKVDDILKGTEIKSVERVFAEKSLMKYDEPTSIHLVKFRNGDQKEVLVNGRNPEPNIVRENITNPVARLT